MKTTAIVEWWDDGVVSVYVPDFEGFNLNGQGRDPEEAKAALAACVAEYRQMFERKGEPVPAQLEDVEFQYKYDLPSFFACFKFINASSFAKYAGINPSLMRQYKKRLAFASEAQREKIEKAIHMAGEALLSARL